MLTVAGGILIAAFIIWVINRSPSVLFILFILYIIGRITGDLQ